MVVPFSRDVGLSQVTLRDEEVIFRRRHDDKGGGVSAKIMEERTVFRSEYNNKYKIAITVRTIVLKDRKCVNSMH